MVCCEFLRRFEIWPLLPRHLLYSKLIWKFYLGFRCSGGSRDLTMPFLKQDQTISVSFSLHWRHNDHDGVSNHQPHGCLLKHLFRRRSKKTSKLRVTGLCVWGIHRNSPHKGPVTRKMFPFDDVIMYCPHGCLIVPSGLPKISDCQYPLKNGHVSPESIAT